MKQWTLLQKRSFERRVCLYGEFVCQVDFVGVVQLCTENTTCPREINVDACCSFIHSSGRGGTPLDYLELDHVIRTACRSGTLYISA